MTKDTKLVVVTGGAGFIGSHLSERLVKEGYRVISLDNYFTGTKENHVEGVEYREGHTKDIAALIPETPDLLFHLGEYSRVEQSFADVTTVWDLNKTGTIAVLEFCRNKKTKLVYAGSSTKFADGGLGRDQSPYAWMKATNTELVQNYGDWYGLKYAITYFYNAYGPREMSGEYGTVIGIFSELAKAGLPLTVELPGTQRRNFTHVYDIVEGLYIVGRQCYGDGYGIGADQDYSILEIAKMFSENIVLTPEQRGNRKSSPVDNSKIKALGWTQQHSLEEWIKSHGRAGHTDQRVSDQRILVYSTTFAPIQGHAESAMLSLMRSFPSITFDVVTARLSKGVDGSDLPKNVNMYRLGKGTKIDKYLLPLSGARQAKILLRKNTYMFHWSLLASYAGLASVLCKLFHTQPLLVTVADQDLSHIPWYKKLIVSLIFKQTDGFFMYDKRDIDYVYSFTKKRKVYHLKKLSYGSVIIHRMRAAYSSYLRESMNKEETK